MVLYRNCPWTAVGLCAVVPTGTCIAAVVAITIFEPSNVKFASSSISPLDPAMTTLLSVRSLTFKLSTVTLPLESTTIKLWLANPNGFKANVTKEPVIITSISALSAGGELNVIVPLLSV